MPALVIFIRDRVLDDGEMAAYAEKARGARGDHKITPLAYYGPCETWEGPDALGVVVLQFPDAAAARAWYESPAYQEARRHRRLGSDYRVILTEGV